MTAKSPTRGPNATGYLHNLCSQGNIPAIKDFLQSVSDMKQLEEQVGFLGYTPLHEAINQGQIAVVKLLLYNGADANAKANGFYTPLHMAASMDNVECVELLLKSGADITCKDEFQKTPFETALIHKCGKAAKLLKSEEIKKMAKENSPELKETLKNIRSKDVMPNCFQEALAVASEKGHVSAINEIILAARKEELNLSSCLGVTLQFAFNKAAAVLLMCYAAMRELKELMRSLIYDAEGKTTDPLVLEQLPFRDLCEPALPEIRQFLNGSSHRDGNRKAVFQIAVPIKLALRHRKKESVKLLLHCTNCNKYQKEIEWRKLALGEIDPSWLEGIEWVEKLYLSSNLLTSVPENITDLKKLCRLELPSNQLKAVPAGIFEMPCLKNLNLSRNKLNELPKKSTWTSTLKYLNLSDNQLESLPRNMASSKLENLYLAKNNLYEVPKCVCEVITLQTLDLSENHRLTQLPVQMGRLTNITNLRLDNLDQITDPPNHIKKSAAKTIMWLRASLRNARGYYSMKLMLVGKAEQGKTTLMKRLKNDYNYNTNSPTNGIGMEELRCKKSFNSKEYHFKVWDFGGQEDYYATHQCFISTLALYLLVWNLEKAEEGIHELEGWLDTIAARAPGSNIIVVGTHLDSVKKNKKKYGADFVKRMRELMIQLTKQSKYRKIAVHDIKEVSHLEEYRAYVDALRNTIYDAATRLLKGGLGQVPVMGEYIAHSYLLLADLIQQIKEDKAKDGKLPIMHRTEFASLVTDTIRSDPSDIEDPSDVKEVTKFLHERGIIMHYEDPNQDLQDFFFIDPKWLCDLLAKVVTLKEVHTFIKNGILQKKDFPFVFQGERFPQECYPQFIRLLNRFQIACSLDAERVLVTSRLPEEKPAEATNTDLPFVTVKRIHVFPYMPYGFWSRFSARLLHYFKEMVNVSSPKSLYEPRRRNFNQHSPFHFEKSACKCPVRRKYASSKNLGERDNKLEGNLSTIEFSDSGSSPHSRTKGNQDFSVPKIITEESESEPNEQQTHGVDEGTESEEDAEDEADAYTGAKFIYEDTSPSRGGLLINGMWISDDRRSRFSNPQSDSDFYSSEEEQSTENVSHWGNVDGMWKHNSEDVVKHNTDPARVSKKTRPDDHSNCSPKSDSMLTMKQKFQQSKKEFRGAETKPKSPLTVETIHRESESPADASEGKIFNSQAPGTTWYVDLNSVSKKDQCRQDIYASNSFVAGIEDCAKQDCGTSSRMETSAVQNHPGKTLQPSQSVSQNQVSGFDSLQKHVLSSSTPENSNVEGIQVNENKTTKKNEMRCDRETMVLGNDAHWEEQQSSEEIVSSGTSQEDFSNKSEINYLHVNELSVFSDTSSSFGRKSEMGDDEPSISVSTEKSDSSLAAEQQEDAVNLNASQYSCSLLPEVFGDPLEQIKESNLGSREPSSLDIESNRDFDRTKNNQLQISNGQYLIPDNVQNQFYAQEKEPELSAFITSDFTSHLPDCPCLPDCPVEDLPPLSNEISSLMDDGFLHCWLSGVCLHHPRLFFMVKNLPQAGEKGKHLIVSEVSPNRIGRQVLNYIVDHIDTLIKEWYPDLAGTDGCDPLVQQFIPCNICDRHGLEPHQFTFVQCQAQSELSDYIQCPVHPTPCNLHHLVPDVMMHDVDDDLLLTEGDLEYEEGEASLLGKGGFGQVVRGKCREETVAMKFYARDETDPLRHYYEVRKELSVLRRVRQHPFLINIVGVCVRPLCLVLELAEKGSLTSSLFSEPHTLVPRIILFRIAFQVADALSFLHRLGVIYRDLKPENILVWSLDEHVDLNVKLIDFGTANFATSTGLYSVKGTRGFHAPEMLDLDNKEEYSDKVDVYSYAILLYQLITRRVPFDDLGDHLVNSAVVRRERPEWQSNAVALLGLPTMTELMLRCWLHKPSQRPTSEQIAGQVRQPAFQMLLGKERISAEHSVRHACLVPQARELWLGCDSHAGNKVLVYDSFDLALKHKFAIDRYQDNFYTFQIQCMHLLDEHMLVAVRGSINLVNMYTVGSKYKCAHSLVFGEHTQITCMASNTKYLFVGLNEGKVRCIRKKEIKKAEKKRNDHHIVVERYRILALAVIQDKLWVASSKYIFSYFTEAGEMEQFDMEALWYGGIDGLEDNPQTQVSHLVVDFDEKSVFSTCRTTLTKWSTDLRQKLMSVNCDPIIRALGGQCAGLTGAEWEAVITCVLPTYDTLWVGTGSGHILIFSSVAPRLLTWFYPYKEARTMSMCIGPGPCNTEQCFVISTGKELRSDGLSACGNVVCPLTSDRVTEIPDQSYAARKPSDESRQNNDRRDSKSSYKFYVSQEPSTTDSETREQYKCALLVWEVVSATVFARIENKSARDRLMLTD